MDPAAEIHFDREAIRKGFEKHHILPKGVPRIAEHEVLKLAGMDVESKFNLMFLPTRATAEKAAVQKAAGDLGYSRAADERTIHSGGHTEEYQEFVFKKLEGLQERGQQLGWTREDYRRELVSVLYEFRRELRQGDISVNKHKRPEARF